MEPILYIGIAQSFFAGFLIATKKQQHLADRILAAWLFLIGIFLASSLLRLHFGGIYLESLELVIIPFTYGPFLYLYVKTIISEEAHFKKRYFLHFLPFFFFSGMLITFWQNHQHFTSEEFFRNDDYLFFRLFYGISFVISIVWYSARSIRLLQEHARNLHHHFSYTSEKITLRWLKLVAGSFTLAYALVVITGSFNAFSGIRVFQPTVFSYIGLTFFTYAFSFFGFRQPAIFHDTPPTGEIPASDSSPVKAAKNETRYERSGLKKKDAKRYLSLLLAHMDEQKPYLNNELTIQHLAQQLDIPRHYLTQVINEELGKNFYTFVNEYRIREVQQRMIDPRYEHFTLLALAYDAGFNSKSAFNLVFKNLTGQTPTQWRETQPGRS